MTYREKAIELLIEKMEISNKTKEDTWLNRTLNDFFNTYTPHVFGVLNAPESLEDWDVEIPHPLVQTRINDARQYVEQLFSGELAVYINNPYSYRKFMNALIGNISNKNYWTIPMNSEKIVPYSPETPYFFLEKKTNLSPELFAGDESYVFNENTIIDIRNLQKLPFPEMIQVIREEYGNQLKSSIEKKENEKQLDLDTQNKDEKPER